jgi:nitronate monooxygenase
VLIPWLKEKLSIPIIAAGGISHGSQITACLALGAAGVSVGTRFIACKEARVSEAYKQAVINASPEDIVMTTKISGTPAAVIRTPEMTDSDLRLNVILEALKKFGPTKKYAVPLIYMLGEKLLEKAAKNNSGKKSWKDFWSAGQSVGLVHDIESVRHIIERLEKEALTSLADFSQTV